MKHFYSEKEKSHCFKWCPNPCEKIEENKYECQKVSVTKDDGDSDE